MCQDFHYVKSEKPVFVLWLVYCWIVLRIACYSQKMDLINRLNLVTLLYYIYLNLTFM
jgi:hypothetical protein